MEEGMPDHGPPSGQIDLRRLLEISSGEVEFEREIIAQYVEQAWRLFEAATNALEARDAEALRRAAHTLKGNSRKVGAEAVAAVAGELEAAAQGTTSGAATKLGHALACLIATEREFARYLEARREAA